MSLRPCAILKHLTWMGRPTSRSDRLATHHKSRILSINPSRESGYFIIVCLCVTGSFSHSMFSVFGRTNSFVWSTGMWRTKQTPVWLHWNIAPWQPQVCKLMINITLYTHTIYTLFIFCFILQPSSTWAGSGVVTRCPAQEHAMGCGNCSVHWAWF